MDIRYKLMIGAIVVAAGTAGTVATVQVMDKRAREARIQKMVQHLNQCKNKRLLPSGCYEKEKREMLEQSAKMFEKGGDLEKAGLTYVEIGNLADAERIIKRCEKEGNATVAETIREAIMDRAEAFDQYAKQPEKEQEEPREEGKEQEKPKKKSKKER